MFEEIIAYTFSMTGRPAGDVMQRSFVEVVTSNFFSAIGVPMAAGRAFTPDEERPGADIPGWRLRATPFGSRADSIRRSWAARSASTSRFHHRRRRAKGFSGTTAVVAPEMYLPFGAFDSVVHDLFKNNGEASPITRTRRSAWPAG